MRSARIGRAVSKTGGKHPSDVTARENLGVAMRLVASMGERKEYVRVVGGGKSVRMQANKNSKNSNTSGVGSLREHSESSLKMGLVKAGCRVRDVWVTGVLTNNVGYSGYVGRSTRQMRSQEGSGNSGFTTGLLNKDTTREHWLGGTTRGNSNTSVKQSKGLLREPMGKVKGMRPGVVVFREENEVAEREARMCGIPTIGWGKGMTYVVPNRGSECMARLRREVRTKDGKKAREM